MIYGCLIFISRSVSQGVFLIAASGMILKVDFPSFVAIYQKKIIYTYNITHTYLFLSFCNKNTILPDTILLIQTTFTMYLPNTRSIPTLESALKAALRSGI